MFIVMHPLEIALFVDLSIKILLIGTIQFESLSVFFLSFYLNGEEKNMKFFYLWHFYYSRKSNVKMCAGISLCGQMLYRKESLYSQSIYCSLPRMHICTTIYYNLSIGHLSDAAFIHFCSVLMFDLHKSLLNDDQFGCAGVLMGRSRGLELKIKHFLN